MHAKVAVFTGPRQAMDIRRDAVGKIDPLNHCDESLWRIVCQRTDRLRER
jgi:hypothetical protein